MPALTELHEPIASHLRRVEAVFEEALGSNLPVVERLCQHVGRLRGKMLRPVLLLLGGQAGGQVHDEHYVLGAVVEMVHMASLVHDDVLDEADVRRGAVTMNRMTGNETAVMLGDFLISRSFLLCSGMACQQASQVVARAAATVWEGELLQLANRGNWQLTLEEYFTIIDRKTAALTAAACRLGAHYAGADRAIVDHLERYGRCVGVAFQIVDDILDIAGRAEQTGKTLGTDAKKGKLTLPMIHHLQTCRGGDSRPMLTYLQTPNGQDRVRLQEMLSETGSLEYARRIAGEHVARAVECLRCLADSPARRRLQTMAELIITRQG